MQLDPVIIIKAFGSLGLLAIIFAESGLFFGFFLPGDSLLFSAGLLASAGYLNPWVLLLFCPLAAILGDNVGFWFGQRVGPRIFFKENSFFFNKKYIDQTRAFYEKHGKKTIIFARFVPIVRTFAPILAGVGNMDYKIFFRFNVLGGIFWTTSMLVLGFFLGNLIPDIDRYIFPVIGILILLSIAPIIFQVLRRKTNKV